jgi:hypothetical protein
MSREFFDSRFSPEAMEDQVVLEAFKEAKEKSDRERIEPSDFKDLYSEEVIQEDMRLAAELGKKFEDFNDPEAHKLALILEEVFSEQIELNEWLGEGVTTRKSSSYDDYVNGVDEIVEIEEENSVNHLAVAVDVTFGTSLNKKFERIKKEIESGDLATVKYFENSERTFKGRLSKVPRVIIGTSKDNLVKLAKLWVEHNNKELSKHPVQLEILDEMSTQLEAYKNYAEKLGKEDIVKIMDRQITIIQKIRLSDSKKELRKTADLSYKTEDRVFEAIKKGVESFKS